MLQHVDSLSCKECGEAFRPSRRARCPSCKDGGELRFHYKTAALAPFDRADWARREPWLWRYRELLPFDEDFDPPPLQVGVTPLYGSPRLAQLCGVRGLFVKDESREPTGRISDRAAALLVGEALQGELPLVSGPLSPGVAAFAASGNHPAIAVLAPGEDPAVAAYGAQPILLGPGLDRRELLLRLRDDGFALADAPHPLAFEGLKTLGLELGDQLAERLPDWIVLDARVPDLVEAVAAGLSQCAELGLFGRPPRILAVNGLGGDARVDVSEAEAAPFADAARRALGLPITPSGAFGLAGLARAVREQWLEAESLALAVVEAPVAAPGGAWTPAGPVPDYESLRDAARAAARR